MPEIRSREVILWVGDPARYVCLVLAVICIAFLLRWLLANRRWRDRPQHSRMMFSLLAFTVIFCTEAGRLGSPITWRLPLSLAALIYGLHGFFNMPTNDP